MRELLALAAEQSGAIFSRPIQKTKGLLYGSYKCATTNTLNIALASTLHNDL